MPRSRSSVTGAASWITSGDPPGPAWALRAGGCLSGRPPGPAAAARPATQTFSTPSTGASQPSLRPSGEILGLTRSGLPNRTSLGIRSTMQTSLPRARRCTVDPGGRRRYHGQEREAGVKNTDLEQSTETTIWPVLSERGGPVSVTAYVLIQTEVGKA